MEDEIAATGRGVLLNDVGAGNVTWHEVGGELDAAEAHVERLGEGADHGSLGEPGDTFEEAVAARQNGDEKFFDDRRLSDDEFAHLRRDLRVGRFEQFCGGFVVELRYCGCFGGHGLSFIGRRERS